MKIDVLGTSYDVREMRELSEDDADGLCHPFTKRIEIRAASEIAKSGGIDDDTAENIQKYIKRHELAHAFYHESGLRDWSEDEKMVDWLALQFPKMLSAFQKAGAL